MPHPVPGMTNSETAYAKINLALHVRRRLPDGYHRIETIFAFLNQGDQLSVEAGEGLGLTIGGPFGEGLSTRDNLVLQAARRLAEMSHVPHGARLHLDKRLPVASGIGGGSADAAATLRLLNRFWRLDHSVAALADLAKPLGADVPACVLSQTCSGTGIGHDLTVIPDDGLRSCSILLINPMVPVSTAEIFAAWDGRDRGGLGEGDILSVSRNGRNDLEAPAIALVPVLTDLLQMLEEQKPILARMSGSGATCFALFWNAADAKEAERHCLQQMSGAWTMIGSFL